MSYYIGATGEYIWEELLENATSNVVISNNINFDATPLTDAIQQTITDALGTAVGELIAPITEVPSATGVGVVALTALGLLSYYKLNRTAVQDVDSMVYSADYASILTPGMFDDRVRIRYDSNQFSNAFYYEGGVKKGEILTSRINLLPTDTTNIDIYTLTGKVGIGIATPSTPLHLYATNNILRLQTAPVDGTNSIEFVRGSTSDPLNDYRLHTDTTGKFKVQYSTNAVSYGGTGSDLIHISPTNINIYKDTEITGNVGIGTSPATQFHSYHATDNIMRLATATNGKVSIEFVRGTIDDVYNDFRLINEAGVFRLQYENNILAYGETGTDLISVSATQISLGKKMEILGNVGINTASHATYALDVNGTSRFTDNVGIGTIPSATYKVDVNGTLNATNLLINGGAINGSKWTNATDATRIYYNTGNVGIGTTNPQTKLHINDATTNTTALIIQNNNTSGETITSSPSATTTGTTGNYTYQVFTYTTETGGTGSGQTLYTITAPAGGITCDILMVGGGGGGGGWNAGGGGAGGLVLIQNILLSGNFTIKVGDGGSGGPGTLADSPGLVGKNTTITKSNNSIIITANGGGGGGATYALAGNGGSGGGGGWIFVNGTQTQKSQSQIGIISPATLNQFGEDGGHGGGGIGSYPGGGGGGAGGVGATSSQNEVGVNGGLGIDRVGTFIFKDNFNSSIGDNGWFAGGGGSAGGYQNTNYGYGNGGSNLFGGGGNGDNVGRGINGINGTGGGGGGVRYNPSLSGGKGGSGIVIIRYLNPVSSSTIELLRGTTTDGKHDWKLGNYDGDFKIKKSVNNVETDALIIYKNQINGLDVFAIPDGDLNVAGTINTTATSSATISCNSLSTGAINATGSTTTAAITASGLITANNGLNVSGVANCYSTLSVTGATNIGGQLRVQGNNLVINGSQPTIFFRDTDQRQGMIHVNSGLMYFLSGPASNSSDSAADWATNYGEWPLYLNLNTNEARFGGEITATFKAVSATDTDHLVVQLNYGAIGDASTLRIKVAFGSFTGFHRCYTDDELYNNETDENIDIFKNKYVGRIVIATGKIKTDFTRKPSQQTERGSFVETKKEEADGADEWYSEIDKDGITIEDAVPIVRLSRQRKDKRVFGVFGGIRSTNNKDRLIVNSIGEGGICVSNTNGNIENGDYIQSSDLLGYGEKQDDDLLHNYTIAKATIDCNFELDSPYYQCHEIENGVRVAFIACSYHCG
jgi:hypothetical protein